MNVDHRQAGACLRKRPYDTRKRAEAALQGLKRKIRQETRQRDVRYLEIYRCGYCSMWHIGTDHKKRIRKEAQ